MAAASFLAPCLLLVSSLLPTVYTQSIPAPNCNVATNTITSQIDADALISCSSLGGSLTIATNYSGSLSLPNVQTIRGGITASLCPSLSQISMPSLGNVDSLQLNDLGNLTDISFPALTYVNNLYLSALPSIDSINLNASNQGSYRPSMSNWTIQNTSLSSFTDSMAEQITTLVFSNNSALQNINFSSLTNVGNMGVDTSAGGTTLSMETLWTAGNLSFANLGTLDIPQLGFCSGTLEITNNNVMDVQLGNLSRVENNLLITDNPRLNSLNLTRLVSVGSGYGGYQNRVPNNGSLVITGNGQLNDFKNYIVSVYGNMYLSGPWSNHLFIYVSWVGGSFDLESTDNGVSPKYDCSGLTSQVETNEFKVSSYSCNGVTASNTPEAGSGGMATGTKVGIGVGVAAAVIAVVSVCWFCRHRKSKGEKQKKKKQNRNSLESLPFSHISGPIHHSSDIGHISRPATLDPGRHPVPSAPRSRQSSWPAIGAPLSTELGLDINERSSSDEEEATSHMASRFGEARMHQETGMEQTAPSSGMMPGTEQLPRYDGPPPDYKP